MRTYIPAHAILKSGKISVKKETAGRQGVRGEIFTGIYAILCVTGRQSEPEGQRIVMPIGVTVKDVYNML